MRRREFIGLLCAAASWPSAAWAQQGESLRRIGVLMNRAADDPLGQVGLAAFQQSLQQLGWGEGRNVRIDTRWGENNADLVRKYTAELVSLAPDVILVVGTLGAMTFSTSHPHLADRVRERHRSGRCWLGKYPVPAGRQRYRLYAL